jgi:acyl-CoA thioester hydrolase
MSDPIERPDRSSCAEFRTVLTRWTDNDMYGHVNNVVHYAWFDTAVNGWLLDNGLLDLSGDGPIFVVAETGCRYFAPLSYPQSIDIGLSIDRVGTRSVTWRVAAFAPDSTLAASAGRFIHVCVDRSTRRPVELHKNVRIALAHLQKPIP